MATKKKQKKKKKTEEEPIASEGRAFNGNLGDLMAVENGKIVLKKTGRSPFQIPYGEINYQPVTWKEFQKKAPEVVALLKENRKK